MKNVNKPLRHGDSIIEVLLAVAIFSAIAVTSIAIMNKGLSSAQTALESTMVRTELDAQAEAIRFIERAYETKPVSTVGSQWSEITNNAISPDTSSADSDYNKLKTAIDGNNACPVSTDLTADKYFLYDESIIKKNPNLSTSSIPSAANGGLWVVAVQNRALGAGETSKNIEYYDFYISACWDALNSPMPAKRTTIIRLRNPDYETTPSTSVLTSVSAPLSITFKNNSNDNIKVLHGASQDTITSYDELEKKYEIKSWQEGTTINGTLNIDLSSYIPTRFGYDFDGWSSNLGRFTDIPYTCTSDGVGNNECHWDEAEPRFVPIWKIKENKFALKYTEYSSTSNSSTTSSSYTFTLQEPSGIPSNKIFMGWNVNGSIKQPGSNVTVSTSDIIDIDGVYYKTATAILESKHETPDLAYGKIFSVTMTFPCARASGVWPIYNPLGLCATSGNNMRNYSIQLIDESLENKIARKSYGSYKEFSEANIIGAFYKEDDDNYEFDIIRKKEIRNSADSRRVEALINVNELTQGKWYTLQVHSGSTGTGNYDDILGLINGIEVKLNCYKDKEDGDGGRCDGAPQTYQTGDISGSNTTDYAVARIRKNSNGELEIINP